MTIDLCFLDEFAEAQHKGLQLHAASPGSGSFYVPPTVDLRAKLEPCSSMPWYLLKLDEQPFPMASITRGEKEPLKVRLPTIRTHCSNKGCGTVEPCNPLPPTVTSHADQSQSFYLPYQCQNCKGTPINFLVKRLREKLTLCGRAPIEEPLIADHLPKEKIISKHYRNATIAFNAGQTLAGICLLRVFVEQFWRSLPPVAEAIQGKPRSTGDELGEAYKSTLPDDFKQRFPTLLETYNSLSLAIHGANDDAKVFEENRDRVIKHFEARRLFGIV